MKPSTPLHRRRQFSYTDAANFITDLCATLLKRNPAAKAQVEAFRRECVASRPLLTSIQAMLGEIEEVKAQLAALLPRLEALEKKAAAHTEAWNRELRAVADEMRALEAKGERLALQLSQKGFQFADRDDRSREARSGKAISSTGSRRALGDRSDD